MKITVLIENTSHNHLIAEHGLSLFIEFQNKSYLLDAGTTDAFIHNAQVLNVPVYQADYCILSHGHYDHSGGFETYLTQNDQINVYAMKNVFEQHFSRSGGVLHDISVPNQIIMKFKDRFRLIDHVTKINEHVYLIPHSLKRLSRIGQKCQMYTKQNNQYLNDDFSHELSLVFDTKKGLIIFNSCSHAGIENILKEVKMILPNKNIYAFIGGLHLKGKKNNQEICAFSNEEIKGMTECIKNENIQVLYTGHCTGEIGFHRLKEFMGQQVQALTTGKVIEI